MSKGGAQDPMRENIQSWVEKSAEADSAEEALEGHMMSFAAEESRLNDGAVIDMDKFGQTD